MNYKEKLEYRIQIRPKISTKIKFQKKRKYLFFFTIFVFIIGSFVWTINLSNEEIKLEPQRKAKRDSAIVRVTRREHKNENCEQYVLLATHADWYPVLKRGVKIANDSIYLNFQEVWKYGKTCIGEIGRYPGQVYYYDGKYILDQEDLQYVVQLVGGEEECLVEEKTKIYNYPLLPECLIRKRKLIRPSGNKIDN